MAPGHTECFELKEFEKTEEFEKIAKARKSPRVSALNQVMEQERMFCPSSEVHQKTLMQDAQQKEILISENMDTGGSTEVGLPKIFPLHPYYPSASQEMTIRSQLLSTLPSLLVSTSSNFTYKYRLFLFP